MKAHVLDITLIMSFILLFFPIPFYLWILIGVLIISLIKEHKNEKL